MKKVIWGFVAVILLSGCQVTMHSFIKNETDRNINLVVNDVNVPFNKLDRLYRTQMRPGEVCKLTSYSPKYFQIENLPIAFSKLGSVDSLYRVKDVEGALYVEVAMPSKSLLEEDNFGSGLSCYLGPWHPSSLSR